MNRTIKNVLSSEIWIWQDYEIEQYFTEQNIFIFLFTRILGLIRIGFGVFLVSNITAIYTKMTIICAPIFILATCTNTYLIIIIILIIH